MYRMVSRRDVEVVVESTTPFLFRNVEDSVRRMKSFLGKNVSLKFVLLKFLESVPRWHCFVMLVYNFIGENGWLFIELL